MPLKNVCPISLYNTSYKVIVKMIATHFKEHMNYLIWPKQCSFILSRQGIDYVIIMKEVFHSMQTM